MERPEKMFCFHSCPGGCPQLGICPASAATAANCRMWRMPCGPRHQRRADFRWRSEGRLV